MRQVRLSIAIISAAVLMWALTLSFEVEIVEVN